MKKFLTSLLVLVPALFFARGPGAANLPYDEAASPAAELPAALEQARASGKRVLIVFGANWCPDCRALDHEFHTSQDVSKLIEARYVVLKVDVGHFDKNLDFARLYGEPIAKGIPSVVVVTPKDEVVYETRAGELANARQMGDKAMVEFFQNVANKPAGY
jgi:thioredoxin 1